MLLLCLKIQLWEPLLKEVFGIQKINHSGKLQLQPITCRSGFQRIHTGSKGWNQIG